MTIIPKEIRKLRDSTFDIAKRRRLDTLFFLEDRARERPDLSSRIVPFIRGELTKIYTGKFFDSEHPARRIPKDFLLTREEALSALKPIAEKASGTSVWLAGDRSEFTLEDLAKEAKAGVKPYGRAKSGALGKVLKGEGGPFADINLWAGGHISKSHAIRTMRHELTHIGTARRYADNPEEIAGFLEKLYEDRKDSEMMEILRNTYSHDPSTREGRISLADEYVSNIAEDMDLDSEEKRSILRRVAEYIKQIVSRVYREIAGLSEADAARMADEHVRDFARKSFHEVNKPFTDESGRLVYPKEGNVSIMNDVLYVAEYERRERELERIRAGNNALAAEERNQVRKRGGYFEAINLIKDFVDTGKGGEALLEAVEKALPDSLEVKGADAPVDKPAYFQGAFADPDSPKQDEAISLWRKLYDSCETFEEEEKRLAERRRIHFRLGGMIEKELSELNEKNRDRYLETIERLKKDGNASLSRQTETMLEAVSRKPMDPKTISEADPNRIFAIETASLPLSGTPGSGSEPSSTKPPPSPPSRRASRPYSGLDDNVRDILVKTAAKKYTGDTSLWANNLLFLEDRMVERPDLAPEIGKFLGVMNRYIQSAGDPNEVFRRYDPKDLEIPRKFYATREEIAALMENFTKTMRRASFHQFGSPLELTVESLRTETVDHPRKITLPSGHLVVGAAEISVSYGNYVSISAALSTLSHETTHFGIKVLRDFANDPGEVDRFLLDVYEDQKNSKTMQEILSVYKYDKGTMEGRISLADEFLAQSWTDPAIVEDQNRWTWMIEKVSEFVKQMFANLSQRLLGLPKESGQRISAAAMENFQKKVWLAAEGWIMDSKGLWHRLGSPSEFKPMNDERFVELYEERAREIENIKRTLEHSERRYGHDSILTKLYRNRLALFEATQEEAKPIVDRIRAGGGEGIRNWEAAIEKARKDAMENPASTHRRVSYRGYRFPRFDKRHPDYPELARKLDEYNMLKSYVDEARGDKFKHLQAQREANGKVEEIIRFANKRGMIVGRPRPPQPPPPPPEAGPYVTADPSKTDTTDGKPAPKSTRTERPKSGLSVLLARGYAPLEPQRKNIFGASKRNKGQQWMNDHVLSEFLDLLHNEKVGTIYLDGVVSEPAILGRKDAFLEKVAMEYPELIGKVVVVLPADRHAYTRTSEIPGILERFEAAGGRVWEYYGANLYVGKVGANPPYDLRSKEFVDWINTHELEETRPGEKRKGISGKAFKRNSYIAGMEHLIELVDEVYLVENAGAEKTNTAPELFAERARKLDKRTVKYVYDPESPGDFKYFESRPEGGTYDSAKDTVVPEKKYRYNVAHGPNRIHCGSTFVPVDDDARRAIEESATGKYFRDWRGSRIIPSGVEEVILDKLDSKLEKVGESLIGKYDATIGDMLLKIKRGLNEFNFPVFDENHPKYHELERMMEDYKILESYVADRASNSGFRKRIIRARESLAKGGLDKKTAEATKQWLGRVYGEVRRKMLDKAEEIVRFAKNEGMIIGPPKPNFAESELGQEILRTQRLLDEGKLNEKEADLLKRRLGRLFREEELRGRIPKSILKSMNDLTEAARAVERRYFTAEEAYLEEARRRFGITEVASSGPTLDYIQDSPLSGKSGASRDIPGLGKTLENYKTAAMELEYFKEIANEALRSNRPVWERAALAEALPELVPLMRLRDILKENLEHMYNGYRLSKSERQSFMEELKRVSGTYSGISFGTPNEKLLEEVLGKIDEIRNEKIEAAKNAILPKDAKEYKRIQAEMAESTPPEYQKEPKFAIRFEDTGRVQWVALSHLATAEPIDPRSQLGPKKGDVYFFSERIPEEEAVPRRGPDGKSAWVPTREGGKVRTPERHVFVLESDPFTDDEGRLRFKIRIPREGSVLEVGEKKISLSQRLPMDGEIVLVRQPGSDGLDAPMRFDLERTVQTGDVVFQPVRHDDSMRRFDPERFGKIPFHTAPVGVVNSVDSNGRATSEMPSDSEIRLARANTERGLAEMDNNGYRTDPTKQQNRLEFEEKSPYPHDTPGGSGDYSTTGHEERVFEGRDDRSTSASESVRDVKEFFDEEGREIDKAPEIAWTEEDDPSKKGSPLDEVERVLRSLGIDPEGYGVIEGASDPPPEEKAIEERVLAARKLKKVSAEGFPLSASMIRSLMAHSPDAVREVLAADPRPDFARQNGLNMHEWLANWFRAQAYHGETDPIAHFEKYVDVLFDLRYPRFEDTGEPLKEISDKVVRRRIELQRYKNDLLAQARKHVETLVKAGIHELPKGAHNVLAEMQYTIDRDFKPLGFEHFYAHGGEGAIFKFSPDLFYMVGDKAYIIDWKAASMPEKGSDGKYLSKSRGGNPDAVPHPLQLKIYAALLRSVLPEDVAKRIKDVQLEFHFLGSGQKDSVYNGDIETLERSIRPGLRKLFVSANRLIDRSMNDRGAVVRAEGENFKDFPEIGTRVVLTAETAGRIIEDLQAEGRDVEGVRLEDGRLTYEPSEEAFERTYERAVGFEIQGMLRKSVSPEYVEASSLFSRRPDLEPLDIFKDFSIGASAMNDSRENAWLRVKQLERNFIEQYQLWTRRVWRPKPRKDKDGNFLPPTKAEKAAARKARINSEISEFQWIVRIVRDMEDPIAYKHTYDFHVVRDPDYRGFGLEKLLGILRNPQNTQAVENAYYELVAREMRAKLRKFVDHAKIFPDRYGTKKQNDFRRTILFAYEALVIRPDRSGVESVEYILGDKLFRRIAPNDFRSNDLRTEATVRTNDVMRRLFGKKAKAVAAILDRYDTDTWKKMIEDVAKIERASLEAEISPRGTKGFERAIKAKYKLDDNQFRTVANFYNSVVYNVNFQIGSRYPTYAAEAMPPTTETPSFNEVPSILEHDDWKKQELLAERIMTSMIETDEADRKRAMKEVWLRDGHSMTPASSDAMVAAVMSKRYGGGSPAEYQELLRNIRLYDAAAQAYGITLKELMEKYGGESSLEGKSENDIKAFREGFVERIITIKNVRREIEGELLMKSSTLLLPIETITVTRPGRFEGGEHTATPPRRKPVPSAVVPENPGAKPTIDWEAPVPWKDPLEQTLFLYNLFSDTMTYAEEVAESERKRAGPPPEPKRHPMVEKYFRDKDALMEAQNRVNEARLELDELIEKGVPKTRSEEAVVALDKARTDLYRATSDLVRSAAILETLEIQAELGQKARAPYVVSILGERETGRIQAKNMIASLSAFKGANIVFMVHASNPNFVEQATNHGLAHRIIVLFPHERTGATAAEKTAAAKAEKAGARIVQNFAYMAHEASIKRELRRLEAENAAISDGIRRAIHMAEAGEIETWPLPGQENPDYQETGKGSENEKRIRELRAELKAVHLLKKGAERGSIEASDLDAYEKILNSEISRLTAERTAAIEVSDHELGIEEAKQSEANAEKIKELNADLEILRNLRKVPTLKEYLENARETYHRQNELDHDRRLKEIEAETERRLIDLKNRSEEFASEKELEEEKQKIVNEQQAKRKKAEYEYQENLMRALNNAEKLHGDMANKRKLAEARYAQHMVDAMVEVSSAVIAPDRTLDPKTVFKNEEAKNRLLLVPDKQGKYEVYWKWGKKAGQIFTARNFGHGIAGLVPFLLADMGYAAAQGYGDRPIGADDAQRTWDALISTLNILSPEAAARFENDTDTLIGIAMMEGDAEEVERLVAKKIAENPGDEPVGPTREHALWLDAVKINDAGGEDKGKGAETHMPPEFKGPGSILRFKNRDDPYYGLEEGDEKAKALAALGRDVGHMGIHAGVAGFAFAASSWLGQIALLIYGLHVAEGGIHLVKGAGASLDERLSDEERAQIAKDYVDNTMTEPGPGPFLRRHLALPATHYNRYIKAKDEADRNEMVQDIVSQYQEDESLLLKALKGFLVSEAEASEIPETERVSPETVFDSPMYTEEFRTGYLEEVANLIYYEGRFQSPPEFKDRPELAVARIKGLLAKISDPNFERTTVQEPELKNFIQQPSPNLPENAAGATILYATDGDSFIGLTDAGKLVSIRLSNVDAFETRHKDKEMEDAFYRWGAAGRNLAMVMLPGKRVLLRKFEDRYGNVKLDRGYFGRYIGNIVLSDGMDYGDLLLDLGLATVGGYVADPKERMRLRLLESQAKDVGAGYHSDPRAILPSAQRKILKGKNRIDYDPWSAYNNIRMRLEIAAGTWTQEDQRKLDFINTVTRYKNSGLENMSASERDLLFSYRVPGMETEEGYLEKLKAIPNLHMTDPPKRTKREFREASAAEEIDSGSKFLFLEAIHEHNPRAFRTDMKVGPRTREELAEARDLHDKLSMTRIRLLHEKYAFQRRKNRDEIEEMIGFNPEDKYYYDDLEIRERNADFSRSIYDIAAEATLSRLVPDVSTSWEEFENKRRIRESLEKVREVSDSWMFPLVSTMEPRGKNIYGPSGRSPFFNQPASSALIFGIMMAAGGGVLGSTKTSLATSMPSQWLQNVSLRQNRNPYEGMRAAEVGVVVPLPQDPDQRPIYIMVNEAGIPYSTRQRHLPYTVFDTDLGRALGAGIGLVWWDRLYMARRYVDFAKIGEAAMRAGGASAAASAAKTPSRFTAKAVRYAHPASQSRIGAAAGWLDSLLAKPGKVMFNHSKTTTAATLFALGYATKWLFEEPEQSVPGMYGHFKIRMPISDRLLYESGAPVVTQELEKLMYARERILDGKGTEEDRKIVARYAPERWEDPEWGTLRYNEALTSGQEFMLRIFIASEMNHLDLPDNTTHDAMTVASYERENPRDKRNIARFLPLEMSDLGGILPWKVIPTFAFSDEYGQKTNLKELIHSIGVAYGWMVQPFIPDQYHTSKQRDDFLIEGKESEGVRIGRLDYQDPITVDRMRQVGEKFGPLRSLDRTAPLTEEHVQRYTDGIVAYLKSFLYKHRYDDMTEEQVAHLWQIAGERNLDDRAKYKFWKGVRNLDFAMIRDVIAANVRWTKGYESRLKDIIVWGMDRVDESKKKAESSWERISEVVRRARRGDPISEEEIAEVAELLPERYVDIFPKYVEKISALGEIERGKVLSFQEKVPVMEATAAVVAGMSELCRAFEEDDADIGVALLADGYVFGKDERRPLSAGDVAEPLVTTTVFLSKLASGILIGRAAGWAAEHYLMRPVLGAVVKAYKETTGKMKGSVPKSRGGPASRVGRGGVKLPISMATIIFQGLMVGIDAANAEDDPELKSKLLSGAELTDEEFVRLNANPLVYAASGVQLHNDPESFGEAIMRFYTNPVPKTKDEAVEQLRSATTPAENMKVDESKKADFEKFKTSVETSTFGEKAPDGSPLWDWLRPIFDGMLWSPSDLVASEIPKEIQLDAERRMAEEEAAKPPPAEKPAEPPPPVLPDEGELDTEVPGVYTDRETQEGDPMKRKKTIGPFEAPRADGVPDPTIPPEEITDPLAAAPPLGKRDESLPFGQEDPFAPMAAGSPFEENDWEKEWFPGDFESELSVFDEFGPLEDSSFEEPMEEDPLGPVEEEEEEWF